MTTQAAPTVEIVWSEQLTSYNHGAGHPLRPVRLELTMALARQLGVLDRPGITFRAPDIASDDLLELVHDPHYVSYVKRIQPDERVNAIGRQYGFASADNPVFARMHEASALVSGASVMAAQAVWEGRATRAVNLSGGLHHAMRDHASGFCVYDDPAVAIAWLLAAGAERVAYVDVDVHHGDGVQDAFYGDPRVLTISLHESGHTLFPGTGFASEIGTGEGAGYAVNVALPAGTRDEGWLRAFEAVVPALLEAYEPQILITQHGCDTHSLDPLAHLNCTVDGQRTAYHRLAELAGSCAGGRWVALGGGGYEISQVVPRAWTHLLAELTGAPVNGSTPDGWRQLVRERVGGAVPFAMTDLEDPASAVAEQPSWRGVAGDALDDSIAATRRAVFPLHGLTP
ncbi:MAG: Histone deacetylase [Mycobacterium sp.]|nr:Histone deacetylase [Mycobacterium sp.]